MAQRWLVRLMSHIYIRISLFSARLSIGIQNWLRVGQRCRSTNVSTNMSLAVTIVGTKSLARRGKRTEVTEKMVVLLMSQRRENAVGGDA